VSVAAAPSRASRLVFPARGLSRQEWARLAAMAGVILGLHLIGWLTLATLFAPHRYSVGGGTMGFGLGVTAYTLGMRHAFDADHISAIDNTTRKLMNDGQRPLSVGFFFSLGHSSIVFALAVLLSIGVKTVVGPVQNSSSALHHYTNLIGTSVSGTFLYLIAAINIAVLVGIVRVFRQLRSGNFDEAQLEQQLSQRGVLNRLFGAATASIRKPWQAYPVGLLFGLGFDTATEVALLVLAGTSAAAGLPWYAILCLPVLFAAGMCLFDTIDGSFMNFAYGWAFSKPVRKIFYNLTMTGLSAGVALIVGTVELLSVLSGELNWTGPFWGWIQRLNLNVLGYLLVAVFVLTWLSAVLIWRYAHVEERWSSALRASTPFPLD
jgi:high-affinity nickel-transport protein